MLVRTTSGSRRQGAACPVERSGTWGAICLDFACHTVLESAAEDKQARVLAGRERVRRNAGRASAEVKRNIVVTCAGAVEASECGLRQSCVW